MRTIKFRVFDKQYKKMLGVETLYINEEMFKPIDGNEYNVWCYDTEYCSELMQYTGLKDKNGKNIYEGDIVSFDPSVPPLGVMPQEDEVGIIKYILNSFLVVTKNNVNYDIDELGDWVVIGNIHENPGLLDATAKKRQSSLHRRDKRAN
ncbi:YopX family protein [Campylobacter californiensis]|uniref:YopX family protein n=1 Tax=Campylobacter californiensis TaxID=1032243 RepID=UPI0014753790|nr:YopX family protein [Campylobacter sp. RM12916]MBE3610532.1 hypothetical protein [Campylobacter sp. RM12916]